MPSTQSKRSTPDLRSAPPAQADGGAGNVGGGVVVETAPSQATPRVLQQKAIFPRDQPRLQFSHPFEHSEGESSPSTTWAVSELSGGDLGAITGQGMDATHSAQTGHRPVTIAEASAQLLGPLACCARARSIRLPQARAPDPSWQTRSHPSSSQPTPRWAQHQRASSAGHAA
eukprot:CAMPEP_0176296918 /NCGR_PEP_ID=MMETSP0121_2-20121125/58449_1 /TAXON_ID=160619 /ORGANISM="Kryptoperidinium foliaceum, Strain CCMP 1326" /LENGTH=171 /DNA_ID=CAMNT_0017638081 /DNA_START=205 /DNA_END=717 /DNA_ORIENTATION=-